MQHFPRSISTNAIFPGGGVVNSLIYGGSQILTWVLSLAVCLLPALSFGVGWSEIVHNVLHSTIIHPSQQCIFKYLAVTISGECLGCYKSRHSALSNVLAAWTPCLSGLSDTAFCVHEVAQQTTLQFSAGGITLGKPSCLVNIFFEICKTCTFIKGILETF